MKENIEGLPDGFSLVRFGAPKAGDYVLDKKKVHRCYRDESEKSYYPILEPSGMRRAVRDYNPPLRFKGVLTISNTNEFDCFKELMQKVGSFEGEWL